MVAVAARLRVLFFLTRAAAVIKYELLLFVIAYNGAGPAGSGEA